MTPNPLLWKPFAIPPHSKPTDFVEGLITIAGAGAPETKSGLGIHIYTANTSMKKKVFCNADGDLLIVPQLGMLTIQTECGWMTVSPGEICVIPRGFKFTVMTGDTGIRGYVCEVYDGHYKLPDLGPIGANGLAQTRDFLTPKAAYDQSTETHTITTKFCGELFESTMDHSPYNVVAFHGNYVPYKYDLSKFCPMNAVSIDHADPSIFTVLTCQTMEPGVAALDFVIFPPRWSCAEHTFRPPYYHRNTMSEYMGLISGTYEAKEQYLKAGGGTLHNCMTPHGPDFSTFITATEEVLKPARVGDDAMAFMFETTYMLHVADEALRPENLEADYIDCWSGLESQFTGGES